MRRSILSIFQEWNFIFWVAGSVLVITGLGWKAGLGLSFLAFFARTEPKFEDRRGGQGLGWHCWGP